MLIGQYWGKVGEKFRIAFPKKFRDVLGDKVIVTKGFEGSLIVVSEEGWKALLEGTQGKPFTTSSARETQRFLLGGASLVELDDKGRFILPEYLRNYAGLTDEVVFLGISRYVEIWDKKRWEKYEKDLTKNISGIAERLSKEE
ncbi:MAG: division/cell wall cluster transcriptional repressor MraZ [Candidatus Levybacteria bacterium]|nr:division/cell wall cluster transcriptional repressor MraZ [Candidatus Levybacteria bacterium]